MAPVEKPGRDYELITLKRFDFLKLLRASLVCRNDVLANITVIRREVSFLLRLEIQDMDGCLAVIVRAARDEQDGIFARNFEIVWCLTTNLLVRFSKRFKPQLAVRRMNVYKIDRLFV